MKLVCVNNILKYHQPILLESILKYWKYRENGTYVDATVGSGGHTISLLYLYKKISFLAIDRDSESIKKSKNRLHYFSSKVQFICDNYSNIGNILKKKKIDGILFDFGISSLQIQDPKRGFSFLRPGPLDMRMDSKSSITASDLIQNTSCEDLNTIIRKYGEEKWSKKISINLKKMSQSNIILNTENISKVISDTVHYHSRKNKNKLSSNRHHATKTFQALRIEINDELQHITTTLSILPEILSQGARVYFISFHSLEDKIVKQCIKTWTKKCICEKYEPKCNCNQKPVFKVIKKLIIPNQNEIFINPRSRSAKLRIIERI